MSDCVIDARRTHQLAYNDTLCPIDHKGSGLCHQRQISHKDFMLVDLVCFFIVETNLYFQRSSISSISLFAFLDGSFHVFLAQSKINKFQAQMTAVVGNRGNVIKYFVQPFIQKPLVGIFLDFNQIRHLKNFFLSGIAHA